MDFKARLYNRYTTERVRFDAKSLRRNRPYYRRVIARCIPADKHARIVDIGCGYGAFLLALQERGYVNTAGVDASVEQVSVAQSLGARDVVHAQLLDFLTEQAEASADVVSAFDVLEHLTTGELLSAGDQVCRVLKPAGTFVIHVPNAAGIFGSTIRYGDLTHERAFTESSVSQFAANVGLCLDRIYEDSPVIHGAKSAARALLWTATTLGFRLVSLAEMGRMPSALSRNMLCILKKK